MYAVRMCVRLPGRHRSRLSVVGNWCSAQRFRTVRQSFRPVSFKPKPLPLRARLWSVETTINEYGDELRDKFAAAALTALLSHIPPYAAFAARPDKHAEDVAYDKLANSAYRWADAMLKARNQPSDESVSD